MKKSILMFGLLFSTAVLSCCGKSNLAGNQTYYNFDNARIMYNVTFDSDQGQVVTTEYVSVGEDDSAITRVLTNKDSQRNLMSHWLWQIFLVM